MLMHSTQKSDGRPLTNEEMVLVYELVGRAAGRHHFQFSGRTRTSNDGREAQHHVFTLMVERATRLWDRVRPLDAYVGAALNAELKKFPQRERKLEIPQAEEEES